MKITLFFIFIFVNIAISEYTNMADKPTLKDSREKLMNLLHNVDDKKVPDLMSFFMSDYSLLNLKQKGMIIDSMLSHYDNYDQTVISFGDPIGNILYYLDDIFEKSGINPNEPIFKNGRTMLHRACFDDNKMFISVLLRLTKININVIDDFGITPFHISIMRSFNGVKKLSEHPKLDPNIACSDGITPLMLSALFGTNFEWVDSLKTTLLFSQDTLGRDVFFYAYSSENKNAINYLLNSYNLRIHINNLSEERFKNIYKHPISSKEKLQIKSKYMTREEILKSEEFRIVYSKN